MIEPTNKNQELQVFEKYSNELTTLIYSMLNARPELYRDYEDQPYQQQELNDFTYGQKGPEFTASKTLRTVTFLKN